jgi:dTDP-glucose 4,6-dehydratase
VLFTARGSATGIDWSEVTKTQMKNWGVKHHKLLLGKPAANYYIDDKLCSIQDIRKAIEGLDNELKEERS